MREVMRVMPPHTMMSLGATVSGTVDASYDANDLCDGDPSNPVRTFAGSPNSAAYTITGTSKTVNGVVVANHNLHAGTTIGFTSGVTATVVAPDVPTNDIRLNAYAIIPAVTASGCVLTIASHSGPIILGEVLIGEFLEIRTLPPESPMGNRSFEVQHSGEYGGLSQDLGAEVRTFGGTIYVTDSMKKILDDWYRSCRNNSLPSVILPIDDSDAGSPVPVIDQDPWVVKWITYSARPIMIDIWVVDVAWEELPRFRWP